MELHVALQQKITDFLLSLPNLCNDVNSQKAFIISAGLDPQLQAQISYGIPLTEFVPLLISTLINYGTLQDERNPLEAVLEAAKKYVGIDKKVHCETLIKELKGIIAVNISNQTRTVANQAQYTSAVQLANSNDTKYFQKVFPYSFADFPNCLFQDNKFDIGIIIGSDQRECGREIKLFRTRKTEVKMFGKKHPFTRHISTASIKDGAKVSALSSFLGFHYSRVVRGHEIWHIDQIDSLCFLDTTVPQEILKRNLILVGGGDNNAYVALATIAFQERFGFPLPIRFPGDEQYHFTCDEIFSELSENTYSNSIDSGFMHCGYLLMAANPWAAGKVMILAIGTKATGTETALLALKRGKDCVSAQQLSHEPWHNLSQNNRYYPQIPAKVVRAKSAQIVEGTEFIQTSKELTQFDNERISPRYTITDFEFLE